MMLDLIIFKIISNLFDKYYTHNFSMRTLFLDKTTTK